MRRQSWRPSHSMQTTHSCVGCYIIATLQLTKCEASTLGRPGRSTGLRHYASILDVSPPPANILSVSSDSEHRRLLSWWSCRRSRCYDGRLGLVADTRPDGRTEGRSETEVLREGSYDQRRARPPNDNLRCCRRRCCKMAHILFRRLRLRLQARES